METMTTREQEVRELLARHAASGMSQVEFAASVGMPYGTLRWWKREIARRDLRRSETGTETTTQSGMVRGAPAFLPVRIAEAAPTTDSSLALHLGDVRIDVGAGFDVAHLRRVLVAVRGC